MKKDHPILKLCLLLEVSASGYYDWQRRRSCPGQRAMEDQVLAQEIGRIHARSRETYGAPRVEKELRQKGRCHGRNRVARLMKEQGLCGRQKGRYRVQTTDSNHDQPIAPNRLAEAPKATAPNQRWVGDTTELRVGESGRVFLAAILDLYSRFVVGWALSAVNDRQLVMRALEMALRRRCPEAGLLHHSDQGSPYASEDYRDLLAANRIKCSMSRRGNCYDNAVAESWFSTLKSELGERFESYAETKEQLFDYIEVFYNQRRRHSALDYVNPGEYERTERKALAA